MKKLTKICLLLAAATTWGSDPQVKAQGTFQKTYGGGTAYSIKKTNDGNFIVTGDPSFLIKMDPTGSVIWHKDYSSSSGSMIGSSVEQTSDDGFIIGGTLNIGTPTSKMVLLKTDSNGVPLWSKTYGGSMYEEGYDVKQTLDGGYVIIGMTRSFGQLIEVYLVKTDSNGNLQWSKKFGSNGFDYGKSIIQTSDSGYVVCGSISLASYGNNVLLTKIDKTGNIVWIKSYGDAFSDAGQTVIATSDGGYALVGYTESFGSGAADILLVKTNSSGSLQWNIAYGGTDYEYGRSLKQLTDGSFIVGGVTESFGAGMYDFYLTKFDQNQIFSWTKTFGGTSYDHSFSIEETSNDGFIMVGSTPSFSSALEIYMAKTDSSGSSGCNEFTPTMSMFTASVSVTTPVVTTASPSTVVNTINFTSANVSTENTLCSLVSVPETPVELLDVSGMEPWATYDLFLRPLPNGSIPSAGIYLCEYKVGEKSFFRKVFLPSR